MSEVFELVQSEYKALICNQVTKAGFPTINRCAVCRQSIGSFGADQRVSDAARTCFTAQQNAAFLEGFANRRDCSRLQLARIAIDQPFPVIARVILG